MKNLRVFLIESKDKYGSSPISAKIEDFKLYLQTWPYLKVDPKNNDKLIEHLVFLSGSEVPDTLVIEYLNYISKVFNLSEDKRNIETIHFIAYNNGKNTFTIPPDAEELPPSEFVITELDTKTTLLQLKEINEHRLRRAEKWLENYEEHQGIINQAQELKDNTLFKILNSAYCHRIKAIEAEIKHIEKYLRDINLYLSSI